jgi:hypothetical protein
MRRAVRAYDLGVQILFHQRVWFDHQNLQTATHRRESQQTSRSSNSKSRAENRQIHVSCMLPTGTHT